MQWQGIVEFVRVAETESFSRASEQLGISTAQVSRQVSRLEKRLHTQLLYRTTRQVSLTQEGQLFYLHCRALVDGLDEAERALGHLHSQPQGKIRLTAPVTYGEQKILPLVNDFVKQHPDLNIEAQLSNQQLDLIESGYDIAIRIGRLKDSSLMAKKLSQRINYTCASPQYIEHYGSPHSLSELSRHHCLLGSLDFWRFNDKGEEKIIRIQGRLRYNSGTALVDAALKGLGIVQLPDYYVDRYIQSQQLIPLLDHYNEDHQNIWVVYPHNRQMSLGIRLLIDYLSEKLQ